MALVSVDEQRQIAALIAEIEQRTDGELVTVLAAQSDDYREVPLLWAALGALAVPSLLLLGGAGAAALVGAQLATFCVLALLLRLPALQHRLVPRAVRHWRAANMARRQFLEQGLHHTAGETGLLLFVSEAEHYVEILADRGIESRVPPGVWDEIVGDFVRSVQAGDTPGGFDRALRRCGDLLAAAVPKTPGNTNELDDRLILIGYD
jgi:putative membrane protein